MSHRIKYYCHWYDWHEAIDERQSMEYGSWWIWWIWIWILIWSLVFNDENEENVIFWVRDTNVSLHDQNAWSWLSSLSRELQFCQLSSNRKWQIHSTLNFVTRDWYSNSRLDLIFNRKRAEESTGSVCRDTSDELLYIVVLAVVFVSSDRFAQVNSIVGYRRSVEVRSPVVSFLHSVIESCWGFRFSASLVVMTSVVVITL